jgi:hypothetical protein
MLAALMLATPGVSQRSASLSLTETTLGHTGVMRDDSNDLADIISLDARRDEGRRDRDGVDSLRDTEAESGDEDEVNDRYDLDRLEAQELGVALDRTDGETPRLD